jgi:hypothetical protein
VTAATDKHAAIEELLEAVCSVRSVPRLYNEGQLPSREPTGRQCKLRDLVVRSGKLVAEARDSSGSQRKVNVLCWKPLARTAVITVSENTKDIRPTN